MVKLSECLIAESEDRNNLLMWNRERLNPPHGHIDGSVVTIIRPPFTVSNVFVVVAALNLAPPDQTLPGDRRDRTWSLPVDCHLPAGSLGITTTYLVLINVIIFIKANNSLEQRSGPRVV